MLHQAWCDSIPQLAPLIGEIFGQDIHVAQMSFFEVGDELDSLDTGEDEGLAAAAKLLHLVDAGGHGEYGQAAETEEEEDEAGERGVGDDHVRRDDSVKESFMVGFAMRIPKRAMVKMVVIQMELLR